MNNLAATQILVNLVTLNSDASVLGFESRFFCGSFFHLRFFLPFDEILFPCTRIAPKGDALDTLFSRESLQNKDPTTIRSNLEKYRKVYSRNEENGDNSLAISHLYESMLFRKTLYV